MWGAWATTAATLVAAVAFACACRATWRRTHEMSGFYGTVALYLLLGGLRQVAALAGSDPWDQALFRALLIPAAAPILFLIAMAGRAMTGRSTPIAVIAWGVVVCIGLWHAYWQGLEGPFRSAWGTEWRIRSAITQGILLLFITLPGIAIGAGTWWHGRRLPGADGQRLRWIGASVAVFYLAFTIDALAPRGPSLVVTRLVTAAVALAVWRVYWTPSQGEDEPTGAPHALDEHAQSHRH